ncbi:MAG: hypothetical protein LBL46_04670 [Rickettsiales bacterium]|jgi:hypothetical protein|nr:hypothetical protein [Rickettsiales bacterium]
MFGTNGLNILANAKARDVLAMLFDAIKMSIADMCAEISEERTKSVAKQYRVYIK